jgi:predicted flap endonuclease-1-like 5' DNA nuclease
VAQIEASGRLGKPLFSLFRNRNDVSPVAAETFALAGGSRGWKDAIMTFTLNQIALLLIVLAIGLVLGLMLSGRGKYKQALRDERRAHAQTVKAQEDRDKAAQSRIAELEAQNARAVAPVAAPMGHGTATGRDELNRISGIDPQREIALNEAGCHRYDQIAGMNAEQEATMEARLGLTPGTIAREDWRGQARSLEQGERKPGLFGRSSTPA